MFYLFFDFKIYCLVEELYLNLNKYFLPFNMYKFQIFPIGSSGTPPPSEKKVTFEGVGNQSFILNSFPF